MGQSIQLRRYDTNDFASFHSRLEQELQALPQFLCQSSFERPHYSMGAELEMVLLDENWLPAPVNQALLEACDDPLLQPELNQYNLEFNLAPVDCKGTSLTALQYQLDNQLAYIRTKAQALDTQILPIGVLPTLQMYHLEKRFLSKRARYSQLSEQLTQQRGDAFNVDIHGIDSLQLRTNEVTLEGANTSFQVHLRIPLSQFVATFNAAQLITPIVLALCANSSVFMGKRLWHETRIALFKQSIDARERLPHLWRHPARVNFGHGWMRQSIIETFSENIALYPALLPDVQKQLPIESFKALRMHQGTIWSWNRPVLDVGQDPHVRIEFRSLPAGPTNIDMIANMALLIGLSIGISDDIDRYITKLPFPYAEFNFYRCAQSGLDAKVIWPQEHQHQLIERNVCEVLADLLPIAERGLQQLAICQTEIDYYLSVIEKRLASRQTGAVWQLTEATTLLNNNQNFAPLLAGYHARSISGEPIADWGSL